MLTCDSKIGEHVFRIPCKNEISEYLTTEVRRVQSRLKLKSYRLWFTFACSKFFCAFGLDLTLLTSILRYTDFSFLQEVFGEGYFSAETRIDWFRQHTEPETETDSRGKLTVEWILKKSVSRLAFEHISIAE